jgi:hypothetical protein
MLQSRAQKAKKDENVGHSQAADHGQAATI